MDLSEALAAFVIFSVPIIGLTGFFVMRIVGMLAQQRMAERYYRERLALFKAQANAAANE